MYRMLSLARCLGMNEDVLLAVAENAVRLYSPFMVRDGTKKRVIDNPIEPLKAIQRKIRARFLKTILYPPMVQGGVRRRSPQTNAARHLSGKVIVSADIKSFFPSVRAGQVNEVWLGLGHGPEVARVLTALTTYRGRLPQGAPTSTDLANLVLAGVDRLILRECELYGYVYTRYIDDIVISGDNPQCLVPFLLAVLRAEGFSISRRKLKIRGPAQRQEVTGLVVNGGASPRVARSYRDKVKAAVGDLRRLKHNSKAFKKAVQSIEGRIVHISRTNPGSARNLTAKLEKALAQEK